ncbi:MAG: YggS family pyridoxal phosphate-dependent enzyme [Bacteroidales bacterium]|jgi:hypothetical protein|nr:YggS family pyridoxal phosphate-dependent enzyme [Bacteroidales bacterium]
MDFAENLNELQKMIPAGVKIIAVSKTQPVSTIMHAYQAGQRIFGENKAQELASKYHQLPQDIEWHFIGHLQTNKVKYITPFIAMVHSIDSFNLLYEINKEAVKGNRTIDCLLQLHIASEETKYGFTLDEVTNMLKSGTHLPFDNIRIAGVMGMGSFTEDFTLVRREFKMLYHYFNLLKTTFFANNPEFKEISMGMSGDFQIAVEEGSTMIRIGTLLFGERNNR